VKVLDFNNSDFGREPKEMTLDLFMRRFEKVIVVNLMTNPREADMQDPLEVMSDFLCEWERGAQVVMGVRISRSEGQFDKIFRKLSYRFLSWISDDALKNDIGDFRLVDRKLVEKLKALNTNKIYLRRVVTSLGFREAYVHIGEEYEFIV
jgi:dolichol-phosphate mannosyltransferase